MDEMSFLCRNCGHTFKVHQQATFGLWYCDFEDRCTCNNFERKYATGTDGDEIEVQYDSDSYRWN